MNANQLFNWMKDPRFAPSNADTENAAPLFLPVYRSGRVTVVACLAHIRRKFVDVQQSQGSAVANEALRRIAAVYAVENREACEGGAGAASVPLPPRVP